MASGHAELEEAATTGTDEVLQGVSTLKALAVRYSEFYKYMIIFELLWRLALYIGRVLYVHIGEGHVLRT